MDIAVINSWPNYPRSAEIDFIHRFKRAAQTIGHRVFPVITSDDIEACEPDFVLTTSEITAKLTSYPTFGVMWTPPVRYHHAPGWEKSVLSYDGYLVGSSVVRSYLADVEFSLGIERPKSEFLFLPTCSFAAPPSSASPEWQVHPEHGHAHDQELIAELMRAGLLNEGMTLLMRDRPGVALCIHDEEHRQADLPSPRLFEAAATGRVIISDEMPFVRRVLGDAALYVDMEASRSNVVEQIRAHLAWINEEPQRADQLRQSAREIFAAGFGLETLIQQCCEFAEAVVQNGGQSRRNAINALVRTEGETNSGASRRVSPNVIREKPLVDVIVRAGGRSAAMVQRALNSIARQSDGRYRAILVDYQGRDDLRMLPHRRRTRKLDISYIQCAETPYRSTPLWTGLSQVKAPFFAILDDDDSIMPDHFPQLLELAFRNPDCDFFYSGAVRIEEDGVPLMPPSFAGPIEVGARERRTLMFLDDFDLDRLIRYDNYIISNSFIARRTLLDEAVLEDPQLEVVEDVYLYLLLARRTKFMSTFFGTANYHWRSLSRDNSMLSIDAERRRHAVSKIERRLHNTRYPTAKPFWKLKGCSPYLFPLGVPTTPTRDVMARSLAGSIHQGEPEGVWTSRPTAFIRLLLEKFVSDVWIEVEFIASGRTIGSSQNVRFAVDGLTLYRGSAPAWGRVRASGRLSFPQSRNVVFLRAECEETVCPSEAGLSGDSRELGVLISSILVREVGPEEIELLRSASPPISG